MTITIYSIISWSIATIILGLACIIYYLSRKSYSAKLFALLSLTVSFWSFSIPISTDFGVRISYFLATLVTTSFFLFSSSYPDEKKINQIYIILFLIIEIIFGYILFFTNLIISKTINIPDINYLSWDYGKIWFVFDLYVVISWLSGIKMIFTKFIKTKESEKRINLKFMLIALIVGIIPPVITGIVLPRIGIFNYYWLAPASGLLWLTVIAYSITKHHLFNIKVIATELITFSLWIFMLVRMIIAETFKDFMIECGLFVVSIILGVVLIRSVISEIKQREQIERLARDLKNAYAKLNDTNKGLEEKITEQTKDVRRAYEVEKEARLKLEDINKTKDQFITSTQHHLRTPMTSLKWELDSIRNGSYGPVAEGLKPALDNAEASVKNMDNIVENFIKITEKNSN